MEKLIEILRKNCVGIYEGHYTLRFRNEKYWKYIEMCIPDSSLKKTVDTFEPPSDTITQQKYPIGCTFSFATNDLLLGLGKITSPSSIESFSFQAGVLWNHKGKMIPGREFTYKERYKSIVHGFHLRRMDFVNSKENLIILLEPLLNGYHGGIYSGKFIAKLWKK